MNKAYYTIIPAMVRCDERLTPNCKLLYGDISALCNQTGVCWATNAHLARISGVDRITVSRWVSKLEETGHIQTFVERNGLGEVIARHIKISIPVAFPVLAPIDQKGKENNTLFNNTEYTTCVSALPQQPIVEEVTGRELWDHPRSDLQKFMGYYVANYMPELYQKGTKTQVSGFFRQYGLYFSKLLATGGSVETSIMALEEADRYFKGLGLSWGMKGLHNSWAEFVSKVMETRMPGTI